MYVKTKKTIQIEIDLFETEGDAWEFLDVVSDSDVDSVLYFDAYHREGLETEKGVGIRVLILGLGIVLSLGFLCGLMVKGYVENKRLSLGVQTIMLEDEKGVAKVKGSTVGSERYKQVTDVVINYFLLLNTKGYQGMSLYCKGESTVTQLRTKYRQESKGSYDIKDCYVRAVDAFSSGLKVTGVDSVVERSGKYYVYVQIESPDTIKIENFYRKYSAILLRHFNTHAITLENLTRFMLGIMEREKLPSKEKVICIVVNELLLIEDDVIVRDMIIADYTQTINSLSKMLGMKAGQGGLFDEDIIEKKDMIGSE